MSDKQPDSVKRALARKAKNKGKQVSPGARTLNRTGGGTPPPIVVSNPTKIAGIQRAILNAALGRIGKEPSVKLTDHLKKLIGLESGDLLTLNEGEQRLLRAAFEFGLKMVPDSAKLPAGTLAELPRKADTKPAKPRQPVQGPRVVSHRRVIPADDKPTSQIERVFAEQARKATIEQAPKPAAEKIVKVLPKRCDTASIAKVAAATRRPA